MKLTTILLTAVTATLMLTGAHAKFEVSDKQQFKTAQIKVCTNLMWQVKQPVYLHVREVFDSYDNKYLIAPEVRSAAGWNKLKKVYKKEMAYVKSHSLSANRLVELFYDSLNNDLNAQEVKYLNGYFPKSKKEGLKMKNAIKKYGTRLSEASIKYQCVGTTAVAEEVGDAIDHLFKVFYD